MEEGLCKFFAAEPEPLADEQKQGGISTRFFTSAAREQGQTGSNAPLPWEEPTPTARFPKKGAPV